MCSNEPSIIMTFSFVIREIYRSTRRRPARLHKSSSCFLRSPLTPLFCARVTFFAPVPWSEHVSMLSASFTPPTVYEQPHRGFERHESCPHSQLLFNWPPTPIRLCEAIKSLTNSSLHSLVRKTSLPRVLAITLPLNSNFIATACRVFNGIFKHISWKRLTEGQHGENSFRGNSLAKKPVEIWVWWWNRVSFWKKAAKARMTVGNLQPCS